MHDPHILWQTVLDELKVTLDSSILATFFKNTKILEIGKNNITIACPSSYAREVIEHRHKNDIRNILKKIIKKNLQLYFVTETPKLSNNISGPLFDQIHENTPIQKSIEEKDEEPLTQSNVNPSYTFDNFVVGSCNRVAHAAALAVVENPGTFYNPLFIYGGTGVGKTHLLYAIGNSLLKKTPKLRIRYFPIERFINDFVDSIRFKTTDKLRKKYRKNDCLLIDDVQFVGGNKQAIQEEFFHTFNQLYNSFKQIVISSDRPPSEIKQLAQRLVSRFMGGLMVDITKPDFETRLAIIKTKAEIQNLPIDNKIAEFIAETTSENIREIEGIILKLKSYVTAQNYPLTLSSVKNLLFKTGLKQPSKKLTPETLLNLVTQTFNVSITELCGKKRKKEIVIPRQITMFLLRNDLKMNLEHIGEILGGRDHTTIMHGVKKVEALIEKGDSFLYSHIRTLREEFYG